MKTNITSIINSSNSIWADVLQILVDRNALCNDELAEPYNDPTVFKPTNGLCAKIKDITPNQGMNHMQVENDRVILFFGVTGRKVGERVKAQFPNVELRGLEIVDRTYDKGAEQIRVGYKLDEDSKMLPNREKAKLLAFAAEFLIRGNFHLA